jgi:hypothetical protein
MRSNAPVEHCVALLLSQVGDWTSTEIKKEEAIASSTLEYIGELSLIREIKALP